MSETLKDGFDAITKHMNENPILPPPVKPPKLPETLVEKWLRENPGKRESFDMEVAKLAAEVAAEEGRAIARLEAWLAENSDSDVKITWSVPWGYEVILTVTHPSRMKQHFAEYERVTTNIEKTGLAATIHAAIDRAEADE